ncbi:Membrane attack complex component/perforin (MACPF) domain [Macleaya cordata]|uniref:Membrane attack complex component/perforin (MACPF) domain n=1 Tax=Macleaya cordata TaxID=56857 RepID=A0A200PWA2_MACCD|nr:Membrane attack complex component/perforin (MACPF) domain [Macleaya cordata]
MMNREFLEKALNSLGKGFDVTSDFRLKYCKGEGRLVLLNETETKDLAIPGLGSIENVSIDVKCDKGDRTRYQSDVFEFNKMSELFNRKNSLPGKIPSGEFNSMFGFNSSSWAKDASTTKCLALDGYFIVLFNLHIERYPLLLIDQVQDAVPSTWDPIALARFIENYGTHVIVGLSIGGKDVVLVRQDSSSNMQPSELKKHLDNLGDQLFTGTCTFTPSTTLHSKNNKEHQHKLNKVQFSLFLSLTSKDIDRGITVICSKRGGDTSASSHCEWLLTVPTMPDAINFSFIPITSLLKPGLPGKGYLLHAINLYLRYKPPVADLQYFLDFQSHTFWAPIHNDLPLGPTTNMAIPSPTLHFNFMGPKLHVNTVQVIVGRRPVTGMRLYLEGMKHNRLAIHLKHLSNNPTVLEDKMIKDTSIWHGSEEIGNERYFEPVQSKRFTQVCTAAIEYEPEWAIQKNIAFIVTGAQLHVKQQEESKSVLHLRLLFSEVKDSLIRRSVMEQGPSDLYNSKSSFLSMNISGSVSRNLEKEKQTSKVVIDSGVFPTGPPMITSSSQNKLLRFVDTSEMCKGAQDSPGYWVVTGAKLDLEKGKICLHVKFSLLSFFSSS